MEDEDFEKALEVAQKVVFVKTERSLSNVEDAILRGSLQDQKYERIAETYGYSADYLQHDAGPNFWKLLSEALREKVTKKTVRQALLQRVGKEQPLHESCTSSQFTSAPHLEFPDGSVVLDSPFYVERLPIESDCYEEILKPGALIRIKALKQMGKTSLLERILDVAAKQGDRTVSLNLLLADQAVLSNLEKFLRWLCASVGGQLGLTNQLAEYWDEDLSSNSNCTNYFAEYLLAEIDTPVTLALDEVDRVFPYSEIAPDFFGLLRTWRNYGQSHEIWKRLRLVLAHSTEVYLQLDINRSPFNVGLPIVLSEFSHEQVLDLAKRHGLDWAAGKEVEQLMAMVGGHPYLVRLALYHLGRQEVTLVQLLQEAPTESGIYSDHLRGHLGNLEERPKLADAMRQVVTATEPVRLETKQAFKLHSMGLVKRQSDEVTPTCKLYRQYFRDRLEVKG